MPPKLERVDHFAGRPAGSLSEWSEELLGIAPESPSAGIVPAADSSISIGHFKITPVGLIVTGAASEQEWEGFMRSIARIEDSLAWIYGDGLAYGERQWKKSYEQMAEITGLQISTLYQYVYVAKSVDFSIRIEKLSFSHHQLVAALEPAEQRAALQYAAENKLSTGRFAMWLRGTAPASAIERFESRLVHLWKSARRKSLQERRHMASLLRQMADALENDEDEENYERD